MNSYHNFDMNSYDAEKYEFISQLTGYEFIELTKSMNSYSEQGDMNSDVGDMNSYYQDMKCNIPSSFLDFYPGPPPPPHPPPPPPPPS